MFDIIAFDADDTLWHNENLFVETQSKFRELMQPWADKETIDQALYETEKRNLAYFGYGVMEFTLSMIETAIDLSKARIPAEKINNIIAHAKDMVDQPPRLLEHARETVAALSSEHDLMIITKGELFHQETKIAQSGLAAYFRRVEIVSEKTARTYAGVLSRCRVPSERFLMVGNSLRSDILPVIHIGGRAVHIPYRHTWEHETGPTRVLPAENHCELEHIGLLPQVVAHWAQNGGKS
jgi:putative hydrolase of the HAD superfamily